MAAQRRKAAERRARRWRTPLLLAVLGVVALLAPMATPLGSDADPLLSGMRPAPGSRVDPGPVTIEARITMQSERALDRVELRVDGRPQEADLVGGGETRAVAATVDLGPGPHTAQVVVWDESGRTTLAWWRFEVGDTTREVAAEPGPPAGEAAAAGAAGLDLDPAPGAVVGEVGRVVLGLGEGEVVDAAGSRVTVTIDGREVPISLAGDGSRLAVEVGEVPGDLPQGGTLAVRVVATVATAAGQGVDVDYEFRWERPPVIETDEGFLLASSVGPAVGEGTLFTYTLEVEPSVGADAHEFAEEAERILSDPRSWTGQGEFALQRVETTQATIRVVLAEPTTVDRYCAEAGLDTQGRYSCWNGRFAMLNADRWFGAVASFEGDLETYRTYLVNHEFGHGLGFGHVDCPAPGELAPVMQQQSIDLQGCRPNGWPFP